MIFIHKGKIIFDWQSHPYTKENEYYKEKCQNNSLGQRRQKNTLEENCAENSEEIHFEFMSRGTPEQNGVIEQRSYTINYHIHLIME